jgi:uncharacterized protein YndB with AHSA1/START domain
MITSDNEPIICLRQHFRVPVERVFTAWSDPRDLEQWAWGTIGKDVRADVDFREGGEFTISTGWANGTRAAFSGRYTEVQPYQRLAHTLIWDAPMGYGPVDEKVIVEFIGGEGETTVVFRHEGEFGPVARDAHIEGWQNVLERLREHLESAA